MPNCSLNGLGTQSSWRIIDDPLQPKIVRPVIDHAQIRQHILDFRTVKESGTTDDAIWNAVTLQGIFHSVGLGIGTIQNRVVLKLRTSRNPKDLSCHIISFCGFIAGLINHNGLSPIIGCPQPFALSAQIMGDHRIGCIQNRLGGAIILLQADQAAAFILLFKIQNIGNGGATEPVNTLVIIAYHANIFITTCQQTTEQILQMIGILILVHQHILELSLIITANILVLLQKFDGQQDNIIKIHRIVVQQTLLIGLIGFCNDRSAMITRHFCPG